MGREGDDGNLESKSLGCRGVCCNGRKLVSVEGGDCSKRSNFLEWPVEAIAKPNPLPQMCVLLYRGRVIIDIADHRICQSSHACLL